LISPKQVSFPIELLLGMEASATTLASTARSER
jgi:hypothetical protein